MIALRTATVDDERDLSAIDQATWSPQVAPVPRWAGDVDFFATGQPEDVIVATDDGQMLGYVKLQRPTGLESNRHVWQIGGLAVAPSAQRMGVGQRLVLAAAAEATRRGARRLTLHVLGLNVAAQALYASLGFEVEGTLRGEFLINGDYIDDVLMALALF